MNSSDIARSALFAHVEWHDEIDSTNDRALQYARQPDLATPCLIGAERQTAGRGRGNNRWWSGPGALTYSLILDPPENFRRAHLPAVDQSLWPRLSLVAALAWCEVLDQLVPAAQPRLKWPNDVYLSGRKVAGILAEVPPQPAGVPRRLVLGIGINLNNSLASAPPEIRSNATALCDIVGGPVDRQELLLNWMVRFHDNACALADRPNDLAEGWRAYCLLAGELVTLQAGERSIAGRCLGIDDEGALLIDTPEGTERCFGGVLVRRQSLPITGQSS